MEHDVGNLGAAVVVARKYLSSLNFAAIEASDARIGIAKKTTTML